VACLVASIGGRDVKAASSEDGLSSLAALLPDLQECVKTLHGKKKYRKTTDESFHFDFGDAAMEVLNVLSIAEMRRIRYLEACTRRVMPSMFVNRIEQPDRNYTFGGSNVTYLTGVFQHLLPDIHTKIVSKAQEAARQGSKHWDVPLDTLGVRSVQFLSFENVVRRLSDAERKRLRYLERKEASKNNAIHFPPPKEVKEDDDLEAGIEEQQQPYIFDDSADEHVLPFIRSDEDSVYLAMVLLSDRSHFHGGEVLIRKEKLTPEQKKSAAEAAATDAAESGTAAAAAAALNGTAAAEDVTTSNEDVYDEEEEEDLGFVGAFEPLDPARKEAKPAGPKFNARTTAIARYTPERGSVLLMRSDYENGVHTIINGKRYLLQIEFWPFADAEIGQTRPSINQAKPLPSRWQEL